ncbi:hypothetical protein SAMN06264365_108307, partial [Actinoplanes regularis]
MTEQPQQLSTKSASDGTDLPERREPRKKRLFGIFGSRRAEKRAGSGSSEVAGPAGASDRSDMSGGKTSTAEGGKPDAATPDKPASDRAVADKAVTDETKVDKAAADDTKADEPSVGKAEPSVDKSPTGPSGSETSGDEKAAKTAVEVALDEDAKDAAKASADEDAKDAPEVSAGEDAKGTEEGGKAKRKRTKLPETRPPGVPPDPWSAFTAIAPERPPGRIRRGLRAIGRRFVHEYALTIYLSVIFAAGLSWPTLRDPLHTLPQDLGDPTRQAWQVSWLGHVLQTNPIKIWQTNAYFPTTDTLAYGDSLLGYAPAGLLGTGPEAAVLRYNILFVLAHALLLFGAYALVRQLGARPIGAAVAAAAFAYAPWRLAQEGHLNIVSAGAIPLALALLARGHGWSLRYRFRPTRRHSGWAALGWLVATWQLSLGFALGVAFAYVLGAVLVFLLFAVPIRRLVQRRGEKRRLAAQRKAAPEAKTDAEPKAEPEAKAEPETKTDPEAKVGPEAKAAGPEAKAEPESKTDAEAEAGPEAKAEPGAKTKQDKAEQGRAEQGKVAPGIKAEPATKADPDEPEQDKAEQDKEAPDAKAEPATKTDPDKPEQDKAEQDKEAPDAKAEPATKTDPDKPEQD